MRFLVEIDSGPSGGVSGTVSPAPGDSYPFSGWLELMRLLQLGEAGSASDRSSER